MPVNQDLALLSDYAFRSAFLIYALALILSIAAYVAAGGTKPTSARTASTQDPSSSAASPPNESPGATSTNTSPSPQSSQ